MITSGAWWKARKAERAGGGGGHGTRRCLSVCRVGTPSPAGPRGTWRLRSAVRGLWAGHRLKAEPAAPWHVEMEFISDGAGGGERWRCGSRQVTGGKGRADGCRGAGLAVEESRVASRQAGSWRECQCACRQTGVYQ